MSNSPPTFSPQPDPLPQAPRAQMPPSLDYFDPVTGQRQRIADPVAHAQGLSPTMQPGARK